MKKEKFIRNGILGDKSFFKIAWLTLIMLVNGINGFDVFSTNNYSEAKQIKISGKVTDTSGESLTGVSIVENGTNNGTITDINGNYTIDVSAGAMIKYSYIGFIAQTIQVNENNVINVILEEESRSLDEVIVIGYGTQTRKNVTGAITKVNMTDTESLPNNNVMQSLRGRVAGVQFLDGARPGQNGSILIRGPRSLSGGNNPLIVLDGIVYNGSLADIAPADIESMEVLKDASASAIYGSRAANGVILITSKSGNTEEPEIRLTGYYGFSDWEYKPKLLTPERYVQRILDYRSQAGLAADPSQITSYLCTSEVDNYKNGRSIDPWDEISQDGWLSSYDVSISGKSNKIKYFFSASLAEEQGLIYNDDWKRTSFKGSVENTLKDWLKIGFNAGYSYRDASGYNNTPDIAATIVSSPFGTWYYDDGEPTDFPVKEENAAANPMRKPLLIDNEYHLNNLFANFYVIVDVPFIKGLSYRLNYAPNRRWNRENNFFRQDEHMTQNTTYANKWNQSINNDVVENILTYSKQMNNKHYLDVTLMYGTEKESGEETKASANQLKSDVLGWNNLSMGEIQTATSSAYGQNSVSAMFRVNYRLMERYLFTATARRDGCSVFAENNKYAFFPSGSLAWVVSEEDFLKDQSFIDIVKLRLSYGAVGNQAISPYRSLSLVEEQFYTYTDRLNSLGLYTSRMSNADLKWETTYNANIGIDFGLFKGRLGGSIEIYNMDTENLLVDRSIPTLTGFNSVIANIGEVNNKGIEVSLNTVNIRSKHFEWSTNIVFSHNKNKIVHLYKTDTNGDGKEDDDISNKWFIGQPMNVAYDYVFDGIYQEGEKMPSGYQAGFVKVKDVTGEGEITADDRQILGQTGEPEFRYGITNDFRYRDFDLSVFINIAQGWQGQFNAISPISSAAGRSLNKIDGGWWTAENKSNEMPSLVYNNPLGHGYYLSRDFVRIQDVTLSYNIPKSLLKKIGIKRAKLNFSGKNLWTFTDWLGPDPESGRNSAGSLYPRSRSITFGIDLSF